MGQFRCSDDDERVGELSRYPTIPTRTLVLFPLFYSQVFLYKGILYLREYISRVIKSLVWIQIVHLFVGFPEDDLQKEFNGIQKYWALLLRLRLPEK